MNLEFYDKIKNKDGFIAALDQSGGSTPGTLENYGITQSAYANESEMFELVHEMRTRIITSPSFTAAKIIGTILFEETMNSKIHKQYTGDYLIEKGIVPFIKVDKGLADAAKGVQLMKPMPDLASLLELAIIRGMFGTKMRSTILAYNEVGIEAVVEQQFAIAEQIISAGLVPIIEPEVNIHAEDKAVIENYLKKTLLQYLDRLDTDVFVMLKLTIPTEPNLYIELVRHPQVLRVVALSGGYSTEEANEKLQKNNGVVASFSRALTQDLRVEQNEDEFNRQLNKAVNSIYAASVYKKSDLL